MVKLSSSDEVLHLYGSLMAELKFRLSWLSKQMAPFGNAPSITVSSIDLDSWHTQLRRVTELLALAVLAAHNTNEEFQRKSYVREYNPDKLLDAMAKVSPHAFPRKAKRPIELPGNVRLMELVGDPDPEAANKVRKMYQVCCDKLHMGPLSGVVKRREKERKYSFVRDSTAWLIDLLDRHLVATPNGFNIYGEIDFGKTDDKQVFCRYSEGISPLRWQPRAPE